MAYNLELPTSDAQTVKAFAKKFLMDKAPKTFWPALTQSVSAKNVEQVAKAGQFKSVVIRLTDLQKSKGDTVTVYNAAQISTAPIYGDATASGKGAVLGTHAQAVSIDQVRMPMQGPGRLSAQRGMLDFRPLANEVGGDWFNTFMDQATTIAVVGENTFTNTWSNFTSGGFSSVMGTAINAFDSAHVLFAGSATTNAQCQNSGNIVTAQTLTKMYIKATQGITAANGGPLTKLQDAPYGAEFIYLDDGNFLLQTGYDATWRNTVIQGDNRGPDNPGFLNALSYYWNHILVLTYANAFRPIANVAYGMLLGAGAVHYVPVLEADWFEGLIDGGNRSEIIISALLGLAGAYFNSTRRNALKVPHYVEV